MARKWAFRGTVAALAVLALGCVVPVNPNAPRGWAFLNEGARGSGYFTNGPGTPPLGRGSALLAIDGTGRQNIATALFKGTALSIISTLEYSTYVAFGNEAPTLQFDMDYDSTDADNSYQGRLVYIPGLSAPVATGTWQEWDALTGPAGGTWFSSASGSSVYRPIVGDVPQANPPCDQTNYCTWAEIQSNYPNARIRANNGLILIRAGGPTAGGNVAATDDFTLATTGQDVHFDFEPGDGVIKVDPASAPKLTFAFTQETATGSGSFVTGPAGVADGTGSARLTVDSTGGEAISTGVFGDTRFDRFTTLSYKTYLQPGFSANAPTLQFDVDYDDSDSDVTFQGRLVFEPSQSGGAPVTASTWQTWDALNATSGWRQTGNAIVGGSNVGQTCTLASPCSLATLLTAYPDARIRPVTGQVLGNAISGRTWLKAGGGWSGGFDGNVDALTVGIDGTNATYDLEP